MNYEKFLIGDFRHGLEEGLQPWLLPQDAWSTLKNAYLRRGVLTKRNGYTEFARMIHAIEETLDGGVKWSADHEKWNYSDSEKWAYREGSISNTPLRPGDVVITDDNLEITDDGEGVLGGDGAGTVNYITGAFTLVWSEGVTDSTEAHYDYYPGYSIPGIEIYSNLDTLESDLMIFDKRRCAKWDATNQKLEDTCGATDTWTGGDYDYFWGCNARNRLYVTNYTDQVKYWDGSTWNDLLMDIDGDGVNDVDTCLLLVYYKERIIALRTAENGTLYPQRARWPKPADHDDWSNDGYVDAPTNDWLMAADFIGEDLIVWFENSCWRLKYTGDADLPFRWELISPLQGCYAEYSGFGYNDVMGVVGPTSILETDNLKVYDIDKQIPDAVISMSLSEFNKIYTIFIEELQQILISYPSAGNTYNDETLCYNYNDRSWSRYDFGFNVFGFYMEDVEPTWDDVDEPWDDLEFSWDDNTRQAGYPVTLGGDTDGYIWKINYGSSDNGLAIDFQAFSGRWNPYLKENKKCRIGWIDFYVDRDPDVDMTVEFYASIDGKESIVSSQILTFGEDDDNAEKIWVRADNGAIGDFHRVKLINNAAAQTLKIHALIIMAKRAGSIL